MLDAQSNIRRFFKPNDIRSLQITTDQLAVAIEKALIVQKLTAALDDMRETNRLTTREAWQGFHRVSRGNFSYRIHQGKVEADPLSLMDHAEVFDTGKPIIQKLTDPNREFHIQCSQSQLNHAVWF